MIVLALFARLSVGKLFIGGVFPGLLLSGLFVSYILIRSYLQEELAPGVPSEERLPTRERLMLFPGLILPIFLIFSVMGSIFFGFATPSEASAIGAVGSIVSAAIKRRLTWRNFVEALFVCLRLSAMVIWIVFAASVFTALYAVTGAADLIGGLLLKVGGAWATLITMQIIFFIMGCFFDPTGIVLITTPIFFPIIVKLGFDPLWFGVLFIVNMEMAFLTPPFGFNLFYMKAVAPPGVTMADIYRSIIPFVVLQVIGLIICMMFPPIITWLPNLMLGE
jgi:tripartite ATP-independent transporter DctM subunit